MQVAVAKKLERLRLDFEEVSGRPFDHFFCPMLFRDEDVELCKGHIVGQVFGGRERWTVQRKDVDNFYGTAFEADFADIRFRERSAESVISDAAVLRRFRTLLTANGEPVPHYASTGPIPASHIRIHNDAGAATPLVLKMDGAELQSLEHAEWQFGIDKDLRLAALVSILKAAHLTLFEMIGYRWALSAGGNLVGKTILGDFYLASARRSRTEVGATAARHFSQFAQMVRPVQDAPAYLRGTVHDRQLYVCRMGTVTWGAIVFIKTGDSMHGALLPVLESDHAANIFARFLSGGQDEIVVQLARFRGDDWSASTQRLTVQWPATGPALAEE